MTEKTISMEDAVGMFARLPGIGKKSASRIVNHLLKNKKLGLELVNTAKEVILNVVNCSVCGNFTTREPCKLCSDDSRDTSIICVVEEPEDLTAIEQTGIYKGMYHVLMGTLNPLEGVGPEKLRIRELAGRIENGSVAELLIATNPTVEGEATFIYLQNLFSALPVKISRIATGIPMGGSLEYADKYTLTNALKSKKYF